MTEERRPPAGKACRKMQEPSLFGMAPRPFAEATGGTDENK